MDRSQILNDPEQALRIALDGRQSQMWTAIPCIVQSINWAQMTCVAQPAIQGVVTDEIGNETFVNLPLLGDVPLAMPSANGFAFCLPVVAGDEVLVVFSSRCIDSWWQSGGNSNQPIENRMHDLSDGFAFPASMSNPKVKNFGPNMSTTSARLTKQDGSAYIELTASGAVNIVAPGGFNVNGNTVVTGTVEASGEVTGNSIPLSTHEHSSGSLTNSGGAVTGTTGEPI